MRKKQIFLYIALFLAAILAMLGIAFGIRQAIRAGNLAGIDWYNLHDKEFVISTEEELYEFAALSDYYDFEGQTIKLGADIVVNEGNAEDWHEKAPAKKWQPITEFAGTFDGDGHSISGLYGKSASMSMGLFSETKEGCVIQDFKLLNSYFTNTTNNGLGSILGEGTGEIKKVYTDAIIYGEGESNGGIAGLIKEELLLQECWFDGQVIGEQRSNGGMIGWVDRKSDVTIDNCLNSGLIKFIGEGNSKTGGFIGGISDIAYRTDVSLVEITNSLSTGKIDVTNTTFAGAAVGVNRQNGALTFGNTYAVIEITDNAATETTIGTNNGKLTGNAVPRFRENLIGVGGYQWTDLDYEKYWSCVEGGTPILKCFAEDELSLSGVAKQVDTSWYEEGKTEFVINDVADFWGFAMLSASTNFEGITIKLGADITMNEGDSAAWRETAPEYNWFPIYSFSGVFDGQGHSISGVYAYSNGKRISLFQQVNANGSIGNFRLLNSYIRGTYCIGAVAAQGGGNISNIYTNAIVENTGEHTGGILGAMNQNGTMSNVWFDGVVYGGTSYTGGITSAAMSTMGIITHALNTGTVYGGTKHSTGGLVGLVNNTLTLSDSLNAGKVDDSASSNKNRTGSVIGRILDGCKANIATTYTTRESYETSIGQGYPTSGSAFVNTLAELTGNGGYQRTLLNFEKYWAIDKDSHPTLQAFTDEIPSLPNVKRPIMADTMWFDEDEEVFVITTPEQLYGFAQLTGTNDFEGKTVKLGKNITLNTGNAANWGTSAPQNQWASINSFNGTFDGCGYTISGLYINDGLWRIGLFGNTVEETVIKNVKVTNSYLEGAYHIGSIAGWVENGTVSGVYSEAHTVARKGHLGGIVGTLSGGTIENAWFNGTVSCDMDYVGGITSFATNNPSVMSNCLNTGSVTGKSNVGGLVGRVAADFKLSYSLGAGSVTGINPSTTGATVGRAMAEFRCDITEGVYATTESTKKAFGSGNPHGAVIAYEKALLSGDGAYQRTILDFNKYWGVVANDTPVLRKFGGSAPTNTNVASATKPDTSWYDAKKNTFVLNDYADLYGFAVLSGSTDFAGKTIKLGNNIRGNEGTAADFAENAPLNQWVPIAQFAGTFDGQGKTIEGLSYNTAESQNIALFGITSKGAVLQDFYVKDSYFIGGQPVAGVVAQAEDTVLKNIYSAATVTGAYHGAGIAGTMDGATMENCWFDGSVTMSNNYVGGLTSFVSGDKASTISHCLNTGTIKGWNQVGGLVGRVAQDVTITDSLNTGYTKAGKGKDDTTQEYPAFGSIIGLVLEDVKATLKATYGTKESVVRGGYPSAPVGTTEYLGTGAYSGKSTLYAQELLKDYGAYTLTELDFDKHWVAKAGELPQLRQFTDVSDALNVKEVTRFDISWYSDSAKNYTLKDKEDLYGFAYLVNTGTDFAGKTVRLGADITVNEEDAATYSTTAPKYKWNAIGNTDDNANFTMTFAGTFDGEDKNGKRHYISGLYSDVGDAWFAGLFGATEGATIQNVEIKNSYFAGQHYAAGVVGYAADTTVDTAYVGNDVAIDALNGSSGGIVGGLSNSTITNCWNAGTLTVANQFGGGIVGVTFNGDNNVNNCLNTGAIISNKTSGNAYVGGLVGSVQNTMKLVDCLSAGTKAISAKAGRVGSVAGHITNASKVSRVYAVSSVYKAAIGDGAANASSAPQVFANLNGFNGYTFTKLDFVDYWVAMSDTTPELIDFSTGTSLALDTSFRASTEWYDNATVDEQGNAPGTKENPYIIMGKADLYGFAELVNGGNTFVTEAGEKQYVRLGDDIHVNSDLDNPEYEWVPIGSYAGHSDYSKSFCGVFDGYDEVTKEIYSISGLYTKRTGSANDVNNWCAGLFGRMGAGAVVQNVRVEESYFEAPHYVGVIADSTGATIKNIYTDATFKATASSAGGIAGRLGGGTIDNCWFAGTVTNAGQFTAGVVGVASRAIDMSNCLVTGTVTSTTSSSNAYAGGLVGIMQAGSSIADCLVNPKSMTSNKTGCYGSVVGSVETGVTATVTNVYAMKALVGGKTVGRTNGTLQQGNTRDGIRTYADLSSHMGYVLTNLDFATYWEAKDGKAPELAAFASGDALTVDASKRKDTSWLSAAGTEEASYMIMDAGDLYGLAEMVNDGETFVEEDGTKKYFRLGADITLNSDINNPIYQWIPIGAYASDGFGGIFDGAGKTISGLYTDLTGNTGNEKYAAGLFGKIAASAEVKDFRLVDSTFKASDFAGAVAAVALGGQIDSIYTNATVNVTGTEGGGIAAEMQGGTINNCWFDGTITAKGRYLGGILAIDKGVDSITNCLMTGTINCTNGSTNVYTGGIIGVARTDVSVTDCLVAARDIQSTKTGCYGSVIGSIGDIKKQNFTVTISRVYALEDIGNTPAVVGRTSYEGGKMSGKPEAYENLSDSYAYMLTDLDFEGAWVLMSDTTPELEHFVAEDDPNILNVHAWYDEAEAITAEDGVTVYQPGTEQNPYVIGQESDLYSLAELVNEGVESGFAGKYIVLGKSLTFNPGTPLGTDGEADAADEENPDDWEKVAPDYKWTPIGSYSAGKYFTGNFNGQGYTISGLYAVETTAAAMFGQTAAGSKVANFRLIDSFFKGKQGVGSIAGWYSDGAFESIYSTATLKSVETGAAGWYGGILGLAGNNCVVKDCWFAGTLTTTYGYTGGIVGGVFNRTNVTIEGCLNTGTITGTYDIGGIIGRVTTACTIRDSLSLGTLKSTTGSSWVGKIVGRIIGVTVSCDRVYTLGSTSKLYATPDATTGILAGTVSGIDSLTGIDGYHNTKLTFDRPETPDVIEGYWVVTNGTPELKSFSTSDNSKLIGEFRVDTEWASESKTVDGVVTYTIDRPEELLGLAQFMRQSTPRTFNGEVIYLANDIIINKGTAKTTGFVLDDSDNELKEWIPIGNVTATTGGWTSNYTYAFQGTFDGQGHTISGLYTTETTDSGKYDGWMNGLFGVTDGATIRNVRVTNSYFGGLYHVASIVSRGRDTALVNCYSDAIIHIKNHQGGGIAGSFVDGSISNCWFAGSITSEGAANYSYIGGILGVQSGSTVDSETGIKGTTITNCLNTRTVAGAKTYVAGLVADVQGALTISKCLSVGSISGGNYTGAAIGRVSGVEGKDSNKKPILTAGAELNVSNSYAYCKDADGTELASLGAVNALTTGTVANVVKKDGVALTGAAMNTTAFTQIQDLSSQSNYVGLNVADVYTGFDFTTTWMATEKTPILTVFSDMQ